jgi:hypothetical protein
LLFACNLIFVKSRRGKKLKILWSALITAALFVDCAGFNLNPHTNYQQLNDADLKAAQQLAIEFTRDFVRTADLAPIIKEHFAPDFIQRYAKGKLVDLGVAKSVNLYFVPGLEYDSRLLSEASPEDWLRFYTAANTFLFFGTMSGIKNYRDGADIDATQLYPATVINLLNTDPILSNMIVKKGRSRPVDSVAAMRKTTAILEQAISLMRQQTKSQAPIINMDQQELIKIIQEDEFFRPTVETVGDQFFALAKGTQIVLIKTPILFRLMLVKNKDRWEILWADPLVV